MNLAATLDVAVRTAVHAGERTLARLGRLDRERIGFKGVRDLVTEADLESERIIVERLRAAFPGDVIIAEEETSASGGRADPMALRRRIDAAERAWLVDPLDGTTSFAHSHPFYAISLALLERGTPALGIVFAPRLGELFTAARGSGAFLNGRRIRVSASARLADAVFATGFPYRREELSDVENNVLHFERFVREVRDVRRCGSAAIDLCYVAAGRYDFYFEAQLEPWDVAAGAVVVREAGGAVTDYAAGEDWLCGKHLLASNGALHEEARRRLGP